jgi:Cu(I)/Ag(I) efflux system membrane fusion protein
MDLIPVVAGVLATDPAALHLSDEAAALADVRVTRVATGVPVKEITLHGAIVADASRVRLQVSHVNGRVERLFVNAPGDRVRAGQIIASLYSPDLFTAQQELLEAARGDATLLAAAREKLRLWKLTPAQIAAIERAGVPSPLVEMVADVSGVITARRVEEGDYVAPGAPFFELADLSSVWAVFNAHEADLPYLRAGDLVEYALPALPGERFTGRVALVEPVLDKNTRVVKARVVSPNPAGTLKPGMYARATIRSTLQGYAGNVVIPRSAVLWTGRRSIVYTRSAAAGGSAYLSREVELGPSLGDAYVVLSGLAPGEEIVTNGLFAVDASAQLEGKRSMMNDHPADAPTGDEVTLPVGGLCEMCRDRVEGVALSLPGVRAASWDADTRLLHLRLDASVTPLDSVARALAAAGHDAGTFRAADAVYEALPPCCKYRE